MRNIQRNIARREKAIGAWLKGDYGFNRNGRALHSKGMYTSVLALRLAEAKAAWAELAAEEAQDGRRPLSRAKLKRRGLHPGGESVNPKDIDGDAVEFDSTTHNPKFDHHGISTRQDYESGTDAILEMVRQDHEKYPITGSLRETNSGRVSTQAMGTGIPSGDDSYDAFSGGKVGTAPTVGHINNDFSVDSDNTVVHIKMPPGTTDEDMGRAFTDMAEAMRSDRDETESVRWAQDNLTPGSSEGLEQDYSHQAVDREMTASDDVQTAAPSGTVEEDAVVFNETDDIKPPKRTRKTSVTKTVAGGSADIVEAPAPKKARKAPKTAE